MYTFFFKAGEDLSHPDQLLSRFNILETELKVQMSKVTVGGWLELTRRTYNGNIGGATWRVKPGDTITVRLVSHVTQLTQFYSTRHPSRLRIVM